MRRSARGLSLLELVIIILLIAIAVPAVIFPVYESSKQSYKSEMHLNALYLAEGKMEEVARFKNVSGFDRTIIRNFNDTKDVYARTVVFSYYSSWASLCDVTVSGPVPDIKLTTMFTRYSSL